MGNLSPVTGTPDDHPRFPPFGDHGAARAHLPAMRPAGHLRPGRGHPRPLRPHPDQPGRRDRRRHGRPPDLHPHPDRTGAARRPAPIRPQPRRARVVRAHLPAEVAMSTPERFGDIVARHFPRLKEPAMSTTDPMPSAYDHYQRASELLTDAEQAGHLLAEVHARVEVARCRIDAAWLALQL